MFSVLVPIFLAIYINDLIFYNYIKLIGGWIFIGISGNLLNDIKDQDRDLEFSRNHLIAFFLISLTLGTILLIETFMINWINLVLFLCSAILVVLYCLKLKKYAIINKFVLVLSHIIFPYLIINIPSLNAPNFYGELFILLGLFFFSFSSQIIHELSDKEAFKKYPKKLTRFIIIIISIISIVFYIFAIIILCDFYLIPLIFAPIGILFLYRMPIIPRPIHKKAGILVGNLLLVYFLFLII
ncbi:MAG: UbiA family prenyltransferase [Candidatus Helarchaeota archaeon]